MDCSTWIRAARDFYAEGQTRTHAFRQVQLRALADALEGYEEDLLNALKVDLGKCEVEGYTSEIGFVLAEIRAACRHLRRWMAPTRRPLPPLLWPGRAQVVPEPKGVVCILGPWNYPVQLTLGPLVGAMAAGNCAAVKLSEHAPETSRVLAAMLRDTYEPAYLGVFEGNAEAAARLLDNSFDHVFFTGGTATGRKVMQAAARHLTPVTLELGGRNPCIVCADADLRTAAHRIAWGKYINAGQTCIAPNHAWVHESVREQFTAELSTAIRQFYGEEPRASPDYGRIISTAHYDRLVGLLENGRIETGGEHRRDERYLAPTVMIADDTMTPVIQEEVFGPILPILTFRQIDGVFKHLASQPKPLALYCFSSDPALHRRVLAETSSGGVCFNDTMNHAIARALPFGGVGNSGMGAYHGRASFDCFTHYRSTLQRANKPDFRWSYPPFTVRLAMLKRVYGFMIGS